MKKIISLILILMLVLSTSLVSAGNSTTVEVTEDETFFVSWRFSKGVTPDGSINLETGEGLQIFDEEDALAILEDQSLFTPTGNFKVGNGKKIKSQYLHLSIVGYSEELTGENFILKDDITESPTYKGVITVKFRPEEVYEGEEVIGYVWYIFHAELKVYEWKVIGTIPDDPLTIEDEFEEIWGYEEIEELNEEYLDGEVPNGFGSLELVEEMPEE
ncbi:MAG: hypothetical protein JEZ08_07645 [Clostridiales bacterium]|nr:hypothetical protein [Clostridiales bacterium]